jgi:hypothetical protein
LGDSTQYWQLERMGVSARGNPLFRWKNQGSQLCLAAQAITAPYDGPLVQGECDIATTDLRWETQVEVISAGSEWVNLRMYLAYREREVCLFTDPAFGRLRFRDCSAGVPDPLEFFRLERIDNSGGSDE